jgi:hypothetical protein
VVPTVLRFGGLRVVIYPNDHRPAHIHVIGSDAEAVFNLNCPAGPVMLRENYGFSLPEITSSRTIAVDYILIRFEPGPAPLIPRRAFPGGTGPLCASLRLSGA